jgi:hypothetical protein
MELEIMMCEKRQVQKAKYCMFIRVCSFLHANVGCSCSYVEPRPKMMIMEHGCIWNVVWGGEQWEESVLHIYI